MEESWPLSYRAEGSAEILAPRFSEIFAAPRHHVRSAPATLPYILAKSAIDRLGAAIALILLLPLFGVIALAIRAESKGPVFFSQERLGQGCRLFRLYKFRTMYGAGESGHNMRQAMPGDPRITRVGRFLRRTSLDELPQLINVLRGNMSLVGPRPHPPGMKTAGRPNYEVMPNYHDRYLAKPGLTGLAQIRGFRGPTDRAGKLIRRVRSDLEYIKNRSLLLDLKILVLTVWIVLSGHNAV